MDNTPKMFKTSLEAAVANLIGKGKIKRDTDIVQALKMSKGTFSAYKNGTTKPSPNFIQQFENLYGIKLSDFTPDNVLENPATSATAPSDQLEKLKAENELLRHMIRLNEKMDTGLELMRQHSTDLSGVSQTLRVIEQQQIVSAAIDTQYQQYVVGRLVDTGDPVDIVEGLQRRAFEVLTNIRLGHNTPAQHNQHSTVT